MSSLSRSTGMWRTIIAALVVTGTIAGVGVLRGEQAYPGEDGDFGCGTMYDHEWYIWFMPADQGHSGTESQGGSWVTIATLPNRAFAHPHLLTGFRTAGAGWMHAVCTS